MNQIRSWNNIVIAAALLAGWPGVMSAQDLSRGEAILDKYVEVTGGKAAYLKLHSSIVSGSLELGAMGLKGKWTAYHAEPNLEYTESQLEATGKLRSGVDGNVAWSISSRQGPRVKKGIERSQALRAARFNRELNWRDNYKKAETTGLERVEGKDCFRVVLTPPEGPPDTHFYDKESGLLLKMSETTEQSTGEEQVEYLLSDYRKEGDILLAHKIRQIIAGHELTMTVENVKFNPEIPKNRFDLPGEIKALLNKR